MSVCYASMCYVTNTPPVAPLTILELPQQNYQHEHDPWHGLLDSVIPTDCGRSVVSQIGLESPRIAEHKDTPPLMSSSDTMERKEKDYINLNYIIEYKQYKHYQLRMFITYLRSNIFLV